ncbi:thiamine phosphate synthase [Vibrio sp.]|nr:thiamine phosphate synthase [Vibrio sp.]
MKTVFLSDNQSALQSTLDRVYRNVFLPLFSQDIRFNKHSNQETLICFDSISNSTICVSTSLFAQTNQAKLSEGSAFNQSYYLYYLDHEIEHRSDLSEGFVSVCSSNVKPDQLCDLWLSNGETRSLYSRNKQQSFDTSEHFAWIILLLAHDFPIEDSLVVARSAMNVSRETWPDDIQFFPVFSKQSGVVREAFLPIERDLFRLYPVVDTFEWVKTLVQAHGVKTAQLRIKDRNSVLLDQQVQDMSILSQETGTQLFVNDYWRLAIKHQAYGVHLGQEDLDEANIEQIHAANLRLGVSTHGYYEILKAETIRPSYIALGHIFPTTTKSMPSKPQGLVRLGLYQNLINTIMVGDCSIPTVAIGGIDLSNISNVVSQGVDSIAVVRAITQAKDLSQRIGSLFNAIDGIKAGEGVIA